MSQPASILVVDDTPANVKLLVDVLTAKGYAVSAATNGADALAMIAAAPPDLAITRTTLRESAQLLVQRVTAPAGAVLARHAHPGRETTRILAGAISLECADAPPRLLTAGDQFEIPAGAPHALRILAAARLEVTYTTTPGAPLAIPA